LAKTIVSGTFGASGQSADFAVMGKFNVLLSGGVATCVLEKSYDKGTNWFGVTDAAGVLVSHVMASDLQLHAVFEEPESGVIYRIDCTWTSGTVTFRMSHN